MYLYVTVYSFLNPFAVNAFDVPYVCVLVAVLPLVFPFPLYTTLYEIGFHLAYNVVVAVAVYEAPPLYDVPVNPEFVYHPPNVYPVFVGVGNVMAPPVHLAYKVTVAPFVVDKFVTEALSAYDVPDPFAAVFQPLKVYVAVWLLQALPPFELN